MEKEPFPKSLTDLRRPTPEEAEKATQEADRIMAVELNEVKSKLPRGDADMNATIIDI